MKTVLALIALFSVALPAGAAVVETLGFSVPPVVSMETSLGLFVTAFVLLIFGATYGEPRTVAGQRGNRSDAGFPGSPGLARSRASRRLRRTRGGRSSAATAR